MDFWEQGVYLDNNFKLMFFNKNRTYAVRDKQGEWIVGSDEEPPEGVELDVFYRSVPYRSWYMKGRGVYLREFDKDFIADLSKIKWFKETKI